MLKKISQISISLACVIILLHAIIPHHHHHDKLICFHQLNHNECDNHDSCCDFDDDKNHHDFDKNNCIIDDLFAPKNDNEIETYVRMSLQDIIVNLDLFFSLAFDFIPNDETEIFRRNNLTFNYKNPFAICNVGLRAPPMLMHNA